MNQSGFDLNRNRCIQRRQFLSAAASLSAAGLLLPSTRASAAGGSLGLLAGEGVADITPPLGIEMGGFHRARVRSAESGRSASARQHEP